MSSFYIEEHDFGSFVNSLVSNMRVVGPVAKRRKFVFGEVSSADELRLDYDVTLLPPKKVFFPPKQEIVHFEENAVQGCIDPVATVLLGVHPYDVRGIDITDFLMRERTEDWNYLAQREATTIVASNVQNVAPRAFWASMMASNEAKGHDAFLTKLTGGYVFETLTPAGMALVAHGTFREATPEELAAAAAVNADMLGQCQEQLPYSAEEIARTIRDSFSNEDLWDELALDCFSCGSCNIVCPTCYCFDVRDTWKIGRASCRETV